MAQVAFVSGQTIPFDTLEANYRSFLAPTMEIWIDGDNILKIGMAVASCTVDSSVDAGKADVLHFQVVNAFDWLTRSFQWIDSYLSLGKYVEVKLGYVDQVKTVFYGIISQVGYEFSGDGIPKLSITGMDLSFLMQGCENSASWTNATYSQIAQSIASKYFSNFMIDACSETHSKMVQQNESDFSYMNILADALNYEWFALGDAFYFRKKLTSAVPLTTLSWGKHLLDFQTDIDLSQQVSQVILRGWMEDGFKVVEAQSRTVNILGGNSKTGKDIRGVLNDFTKKQVMKNVSSQQDANNQAEAELNKLSMNLIHGSGTCIGIPELRAGLYLKFDGLGSQFSQPLYIVGATHKINEGGYTTTFQVRGNAL